VKDFGVKLKKVLPCAVLLALSFQGLAQAAGSIELQRMCTREQLEIHRGQNASKLNEDAFNGFCSCVSTHLEQHLSSDQLKAVLEASKNKPAWLRTAKRNAHSACLKPSAKFST